MQVSVEKLSPVVVELSVEVPATRVKSEVDRAYGSLQRTARVRGYRPGKAPREVLHHLFAGRVYADVAQRLVDETLKTALQERSVDPISKPSISPGELTPENAFSYKARFEVKPDLANLQWRGLAIQRPAVAVDDAAIDAELARLQREHATEEPPSAERPAQLGDLVSLGFTLWLGDKEHTRGEQTANVELGKGELASELESAAVGMNVGETKDVDVTFPESHTNPELRGKVGTFKLSVKSLRVRVLPPIDDELAKDCGEFETLDALRRDLRENLEKAAKQRQTETMAEQVVQELCRKNPIAVPPTLIDQQASMSERELLMNARRAGKRLDSSVDWRAAIRADAEMKVRAGLIMGEIARENQITIDDGDFEKAYVELAEQTGKNVNKIKADHRDRQKREMLAAMILEDKILDVVEAAAVITDS
jgi:trigger factor